jgi:hypothetical protein
MEIDMTKTYTVADIIDDLFLTPRLFIVVKIDGAYAWVSTVFLNGDHNGLMHRVNTSSLLNIREMDLLA